MTDYTWRASIVEDWSLGGGSKRLFIHRHGSEESELITGFTDAGTPVITSFARDASSLHPGLAIPIDALDSIAERLKPGPAQGEVMRLEEALAVERRRVDDLLTQLRSQLR